MPTCLQVLKARYQGLHPRYSGTEVSCVCEIIVSQSLLKLFCHFTEITKVVLSLKKKKKKIQYYIGWIFFLIVTQLQLGLLAKGHSIHLYWKRTEHEGNTIIFEINSHLAKHSKLQYIYRNHLKTFSHYIHRFDGWISHTFRKSS